ncbi:MAG: hypothetical protein IT175_06080 [Acidobacteria bacterium]|nr:hypothetical protein [Acidobacteriota bacterium]
MIALGGSTGKSSVPHPLYLIVQQLASQCDRLQRSLSKTHSGPDPVARVKGSIGKSPAAKRREKADG